LTAAINKGVSKMQSIPENILRGAAVQWQLTSARFEEWAKTDLFRFKWWLLLVIFIFSLLVWWKTVDKSRFNEIMLFATFVSIMILVFDEMGEEMTLWDYGADIFPLFPPIAAINLACLPFVYSLIYQYFKTWKSFTIASIIMSVVACFILEPLFVLSGIYQMITWKSYYGLPLYFGIAVCARAASVKIYSIESKYKKDTGICD
jgi:hypothetical protein